MLNAKCGMLNNNDTHVRVFPLKV